MIEKRKNELLIKKRHFTRWIKSLKINNLGRSLNQSFLNFEINAFSKDLMINIFKDIYVKSLEGTILKEKFIEAINKGKSITIINVIRLNV